MISRSNKNTDAYEYHKEITKICSDDKQNELQLASGLWFMKRYDLWRDAVGGIDRWEDYLKQPEINISTRKANKLIRIYEFFTEKAKGWDLEGVPTYALDYIATKKITDTGKIQELLDAGKYLSQTDFKERFHDLVNGKDETEAVRTYSYMIMKKCNETGTLTKVHDITSDDIKEKFNL